MSLYNQSEWFIQCFQLCSSWEEEKTSQTFSLSALSSGSSFLKQFTNNPKATEASKKLQQAKTLHARIFLLKNIFWILLWTFRPNSLKSLQRAAFLCFICPDHFRAHFLKGVYALNRKGHVINSAFACTTLQVLSSYLIWCVIKSNVGVCKV